MTSYSNVFAVKQCVCVYRETAVAPHLSKLGNIALDEKNVLLDRINFFAVVVFH